ncbi:hypothetical protein, partial [Crocosphaera watsonii]|uniref:hypothetical protein n=2 Tax=Crocosphaera watsonii TaxID=263511 RepID=UPI00066108F0
NNAGTIIWKDGRIEGDFSNENDIINNTGIFEIQTGDSDEYIYYITFNNDGTIIKSQGTGTNYFTRSSSSFNNRGLVDIQSGNLDFSGEGNSEGGTIKTDENTSISWSGNYTFDEDSQINTQGIFQVSGGTVEVGLNELNLPKLIINSGTLNTIGTVNIETLDLTGGTLNTEGRVNLTGQNDWTAGTLSGTGIINIDSAST